MELSWFQKEKRILKDLTRGKRLTEKAYIKFIEGLDISAPEKKRLKNLTPQTYIGLAVKLVDNYKVSL